MLTLLVSVVRKICNIKHGKIPLSSPLGDIFTGMFQLGHGSVSFRPHIETICERLIVTPAARSMLDRINYSGYLNSAYLFSFFTIMKFTWF